MTFFLLIAGYTLYMHLIINSSDIYYLTGVRSHDPGEILIIYGQESIQVVFCDPRTSGLFDSEKYQVCGIRGEWGEKFSNYQHLHTDPDFLTQALREKIE